MIPLDFTPTSRLSVDDKSLPSPHKATTDSSEQVFNNFSQSTSLTPTHSEQLQSSMSSSLVHRTLRPRRHTRRHHRLQGGPTTSWCVHRVTSQQRRRQEQRRHSVDTATSHVTSDLPQSLECRSSTRDDVKQQECQPAAPADQRVIPAVHSSSPTNYSCLYDNSPAAAARRTARTPTVNTHPLPADPRQWSRDDVHTWLREMSLTFNMAAIDTNMFPFNGKAVCILSPAMFLSRVPCGGKLLFREFQCRLLRALHLSVGAL